MNRDLPTDPEFVRHGPVKETSWHSRLFCRVLRIMYYLNIWPASFGTASLCRVAPAEDLACRHRHEDMPPPPCPACTANRRLGCMPQAGLPPSRKPLRVGGIPPFTGKVLRVGYWVFIRLPACLRKDGTALCQKSGNGALVIDTTGGVCGIPSRFFPSCPTL